METSRGASFPKNKRLRKRIEFLHVNQVGRKHHTPHFLIFVARQDLPQARVGITVSRKIGGAVQRNRVKRLVREYFRLNFYCFAEHVAVSVIAKRGADQLDWSQVSREFNFLLDNPKILG